ncbi:hypothetical protein SAMN05192553_104250 [Cyclobacterium xiamenense]|uniref:Uncharacterized protein n=1 Tax=Cyclobacterium xiamenense TaxID=1297121 RepID=A0A1H6ZBX2_9BACT|nr:hypothetical protein [Cyclobacterium xiamenense]SEJ48927.1 hypothetical protein SAMN05192553_104250 [Cyclobacterium xiamenense]
MKIKPTYRRKLAVWAVLLVYFFSLSCHVVFVHSHWDGGQLVALHAHPYNLGTEGNNSKKNDTHSEEEYELYKLIFASPLLELGFYEVIIESVVPEPSVTPAFLPQFHQETFRSHRPVRGPPLFV